MVHGMKMELLENMVQRLKRRANLSDEICEDLRDIQYSKSNKKQTSCKFISGSKIDNRVGCIAMIRDDTDNTFSCAYILHKLNVTLGTVNVLKSTTPQYFFLLKMGEDFLYYGEGQFGLNEFTNEELLNTYLQYRAMEGCQNKGIIPAINYVE